MKVLVSAYACNPYLGSEPGVGWAAVCRIAKEHEVFLLADQHNKDGLERAAREGLIPDHVHVRLVNNYTEFCSNRFFARIQNWLYFVNFNRKVLDAANSWHQEIGFDLCHQVTIASYRVPSPLWQLPIPFLWGPIGGAGYIPPQFRSILGLSARVFEVARDVSTWLSFRSSKLRACINHTAVIFAANAETEDYLRPLRGSLPMERLPIASISEEKIRQFRRPLHNSENQTLKLFAGGNIEGRKGVSLALRALAKVAESGVKFRYTIAGGGPEVPVLKKLCAELKLDAHVVFHPGFSGAAYVEALHQSDVYFLPSFRESTPVTLLEAYLAGCYPVVADVSAQGEIVRLAGGHALPAINPEQLVDELAQAILWCDQNRDQLPSLVEKSIVILSDYFSSDRYETCVNDSYRLALLKSQK